MYSKLGCKLVKANVSQLKPLSGGIVGFSDSSCIKRVFCSKKKVKLFCQSYEMDLDFGDCFWGVKKHILKEI